MGRILNNKFANYLPLTGGTVSGQLNCQFTNLTRGNECNFVPSDSSATNMYFNYRSCNTNGGKTTNAIDNYKFYNGQNGWAIIQARAVETAAGLVKITYNGNTTTIGSQNSSYCHIYNSANIPFYFNKNILVNGNTLSSIVYKDVSFSKTVASKSYEYVSLTVPTVTGFTCIGCSVYYGTGSSNGYMQVSPRINGDVALYNPTGSSVTDTFYIRYIYMK